MSLTKRYLESQPEFQSNDALLETAIRDIERAARRLSRIENLCELTIGDVAEITKSLNRAALRLALARQENESAF